MIDIVGLLTNLGPNFAGLIVAVWIGYFAFKRMDRIANNALHGVADSNQKIALTQSEIVTTLKDISTSIKEHSESDIRVFEQIRSNLEKQTESLIRLEDRSR